MLTKALNQNQNGEKGERRSQGSSLDGEGW